VTDRTTCVATVFHSASLGGTLSRLLPELRLVPLPRSPPPGERGHGAVVVELDADRARALAALGRATKASAEVPVVALSRDADPKWIERILAGGAYDCVPFPIEVPRLQNALRRALEHGALQYVLSVRPPASALPTLELARLERLAIEEALRATNMNFAEAAKLLGLGRSTLYRRVTELLPAPPAAEPKAPGVRRRRSIRPTT